MSDQPYLLTCHPDMPLKGGGQRRTRIGHAVEEAVCALLDLTPVKIDGTKTICEDARSRRNTPVEIKSVRSGQKTVIYKWRMEKEALLLRDLVYVFGVHQIRKPDTLRSAWECLATSGMTLVIAPAWVVYDVCQQHPLRTIKTRTTSSGTRNGYQRAGYKDGYRNVPIRQIAELCCGGDPVEVRLHDLVLRAETRYHHTLRRF